MLKAMESQGYVEVMGFRITKANNEEKQSGTIGSSQNITSSSGSYFDRNECLREARAYGAHHYSNNLMERFCSKNQMTRARAWIELDESMFFVIADRELAGERNNSGSNCIISKGDVVLVPDQDRTSIQMSLSECIVKLSASEIFRMMDDRTPKNAAARKFGLANDGHPYMGEG